MSKDRNSNKSNNVKIEEYEKCVCCGTVTEVKRNMPIDARKYYVNGVGQLCIKCYLDLRDKAVN